MTRLGRTTEPASLRSEEIERRAQDRARSSASAGGMDVAHDAAPGSDRDGRGRIVGTARLPARDPFRSRSPTPSGRRRSSVAQPQLVYGPLTPLLGDDDVWEIADQRPRCDLRSIAPRRSERVPRRGVPRRRARTCVRSPDCSTTRRASHRKLDPAEGLQDARLDDGSRVHIVHGDIGRAGHLLVNIRRFTGVPIRIARRAGRAWAHSNRRSRHRSSARASRATRLDCLRRCARRGQDDHSCPAALAELDPSLRVVVAEEVFEADIPLPNVAQHADPSGSRRPSRGRPPQARRRLPSHGPRCRRSSARSATVRRSPLLLTLSSGVNGFTTIHAGSATPGVRPGCGSSASCPTSGATCPFAALSTLVTDAVDLVDAHCARTPDGRAGHRASSPSRSSPAGPDSGASSR